jgi:hypothetical protein
MSPNGDSFDTRPLPENVLPTNFGAKRMAAKMIPTQILRRGVLSVAFVACAFWLAVFAAGDVDAANVKFTGNVGYSYTGNTAVLTADAITNLDASGVSGNLRLELWAFSTTYTGTGLNGYALAQYSVGELSAGDSFSMVSSGSVPFTPPPDGSWTFVMILTELTGGPTDGGYDVRDWSNFTPPVLIGPAPPSITPKVGLWWNPAESGTGYALDVSNGVLAITIYSFLADGSAQWYASAGPIVGNSVSASLDKYVGGQCIGCAYNGSGTVTGNDGTITITFTTATSATAYLPNGRVTQIQPFFP